VKRATLDALRGARARGQQVALVTALADGSQRLVTLQDGAAGGGDRLEAVAPDSPLGRAVAKALQGDQAEVVAIDGAELFIEPHHAPLRLLLVGAVHLAHPLASMAEIAGFAVTIIDPRRAFATAARFPGARLVVRWPDDALRELLPDARTAVVTLTHDPKLDDVALIEALRSPAFYLGCLGSQKTHASRRARLAAAGFDDAALARLHGPVGLPLGARAPAEIAVSILAEIIAVLRGKGAPRP
jgi:xanthine dehydrogenase accessory factor